MKRTVLLVLLVTVFCPLLCIAESPSVDLHSMSVEELIQLKTEIANELMQKGEVKSVEVPAGEYIVGEDIPTGDYTLTSDAVMVMVSVEDEEGSPKHTYVLSDGQGSSIGKLTLEKGYTISLTGNCTFSVYSGLGF